MAKVAFANPFEEDRLDGVSDFRGIWDVPSLHKTSSEWLTSQVSRVKHHPERAVDRKIAVMLGPPGFGKTHVFARVADQLRQQVLFAFVPQVPEQQLTSPTGHICWHVVEALFNPPPNGRAAVDLLMAGVCQKDFESYFDQLPEVIRVGQKSIRQKISNDPAGVLEIVDVVRNPEPYQRLADSVAATLPTLQSEIVRAVALGWSPFALDVRRWLRGDDLPDELCGRLKLGNRRPDPEKVIEVIATMLQIVSTPLVICCDQLEAVLKEILEDPNAPIGQGPISLSNGLMALLHSTPNLLIVLSCLTDAWEIFHPKAQKGFKDRLYDPLRLLPLTAAQAVELVERRLRTWRYAQASKSPTWPIKAQAVVDYVSARPRPPRDLVKACKVAIDKWMSNGGAASNGGDEVAVIDPTAFVPPLDAFNRLWNKRLDTVRKQSKSADDIQESELFGAVWEALSVAKIANHLPHDVRWDGEKQAFVHPTKNDLRPSVLVVLTCGERRYGVVVAVSKRDSGVSFGHYFSALQEAFTTKGVVGAVLIRHKAELGVGPTAAARKEFEKAVSAKKLRPFPLDQERATLDNLQCLTQLLHDADGGLVDVNGKKLTRTDCTKLLAEIGLLKNLRLFEIIFSGWVGGAAIAAPAPASGQGVVGAGATAVAIPTITPLTLAQPAPLQPPLPFSATTGTSSGAPADSTALGAGPSRPAPPVSPSGDPLEAWANELLLRVAAKLQSISLPVKPFGVQVGPTFARLRVQPADRTDINKLRRSGDRLMVLLGLAAAPLVGFQAGYVSIDVALPARRTVALAPLFKTRPTALSGLPAFPVGLDVGGKDHWLNLADSSSCHLLIAGTTGSGKSELMKAILGSLAHSLTPQQVRFVLIDPKRVTFNFRGASPYFDAPVAHDNDEAMPLLQKAVEEMERRYALLEKQHKSNVSELAAASALPQIVLIFDEFADLILDKGSKAELEGHLKRLGAKARAAGIHIILGTQRTEASIVTPLLRSNLPGRISLKVTSDRDSNLILDDSGAAELLGKGDLLWKTGGELMRLQSPYVGQNDLEKLLRIP